MSWPSVPIVTGIATAILLSSYFHFLTHTLMIGAAVQSGYHEQKMKLHVGEMSAAAILAAELQVASTRDQIVALRFREQGIIYAEKAIELYREAAVIEEKSQLDFLEAAGYQTASREWAVKSAVEGDEAVYHVAIAAEEELEYEALIAKGSIESAMAVRDEELAVIDVEVIAGCEFIPFLAFFCDLVGGAAAIGFHTKAASEAAEAAADFTAAAALKIEEAIELTLAEDLEAQSVRDAALSNEYSIMAKEKLEEAELEQEAAILRKEEADAEMLISYEENAKAMAFAAKAEEESYMAATSLTASINFGMSGIFDAVAILGSSICVFSLSIFKFVFYSLIPAIYFFLKELGNAKVKKQKESGEVGFLPSLRQLLHDSMRIISFWTIHVWIFLGVSILFFEQFFIFSTMTIRGKGGLVIMFALSSALIQCLVLLLCNRIARARSTSFARRSVSVRERILDSLMFICKVSTMFMRDLIFYFIVFVLEFLIVWLSYARFVFRSEVHIPYSWVLIAILPFAICTHVYCLEKEPNHEFVEQMDESISCDELGSESTQNTYCDTGSAIHEETRKIIKLLESDHRFRPRVSLVEKFDDVIGKIEHMSRSSACETKYNFSFNLRNLEIPFELFLISLTVAFLRNSIPNLKLLYPVISYFLQKLVVHVGFINAAGLLIFFGMFLPVFLTVLVYYIIVYFKI